MMRYLILVTDAYGGRGGIAQFNRDMIHAISQHEDVHEIVVLPRLIFGSTGTLPKNLTFVDNAAGSRFRYLFSLLRLFAGNKAFDGVICGHINLLPMATLAASRFKAPLILTIHGIEIWQKPSRKLASLCVNKIDAVVSVSTFSKNRFLKWSRYSPDQIKIVPNCVELSRFGPGPKPVELVEQYMLRGKTVIMTLGRLSKGRLKGTDAVLRIFPSLVNECANLVYLIAGDGDARSYLEELTQSLGLSEHVIFTGYLSEADKIDHYRLADAFVMPGRAEGFGIVYLEALACGIPVVASIKDASREAVRDGLLGQTVDPDDPEDLKRGILWALQEKSRRVPDGLDYFSVQNFQTRWHRVLSDVFSLSRTEATSPITAQRNPGDHLLKDEKKLG